MASGRLHVYLGAVPAAGKTHAMLAEGRRLSGLGVAALFVLTVMMITRGLQLILGAIGTLFVGLAVFVLLNFLSSGASVQGPMLPTFWHVLNRFWIGASASDAFRSIVYFGGQGAGTDVLKLLGWLAVGVVLLALGWFKLRHGPPDGTPAERSVARLGVDSARAD